MKTITREEVLWHFHYDRPNGKLYWKNHWDKTSLAKFKGKEANTKDNHGYLRVMINYTAWSIHRLVYFLETDTWPEIIDHINGDKTDNRFGNLKSSDARKNMQNMYLHREGKLVGTHFAKNVGRWRSLIRINKKLIHLGLFDTELEAHQRYVQELQIRGLK